MPGGFIGVDVFFVISGYVIARSYLYSLINGEKTLRQFYLARIRRLAPAAFMLLAAVTIAAALMLPPYDLSTYAQSLGAQSIWMQNFVFWYQGEYFDKALTRPLLHTWSLAVEEQFYLGWAILIPLLRFRPRWTLAVITALALISLAAGFALAPRSPKTVFYLLPFRIWEFALGIFAFELRRFVPLVSKKVMAWAAAACCLGLLWTGLAFGEDAALPGAHSIFACLITTVILALLEKNAPAGNRVAFMQWRPALYVGKISYGFYLWHWPPLVLWYLHNATAASPLAAAAITVGAFAAASASYHLIENPIRQRRALASSRALLGLFAGMSAVLVMTSVALISSNGLAARYAVELRPFLTAKLDKAQVTCAKTFTLLNPAKEFCPIAGSDLSEDHAAVLILGDSHAENIAYSARELAEQNGTRLFLTSRNCDLGTFGKSAYCSRSVLETIAQQAKDAGVETILVASLFQTSGLDDETLLADLSVLQRVGARIVVLADWPMGSEYDPETNALYALEGKPLDRRGITRAAYERQRAEALPKLQRAARQVEGVELIDPANALCGPVSCPSASQTGPFYIDADHLSKEGNRKIAPLIERYFAR